MHTSIMLIGDASPVRIRDVGVVDFYVAILRGCEVIASEEPFAYGAECAQPGLGMLSAQGAVVDDGLIVGLDNLALPPFRCGIGIHLFLFGRERPIAVMCYGERVVTRHGGVEAQREERREVVVFFLVYARHIVVLHVVVVLEESCLPFDNVAVVEIGEGGLTLLWPMTFIAPRSHLHLHIEACISEVSPEGEAVDALPDGVVDELAREAQLCLVSAGTVAIVDLTLGDGVDGVFVVFGIDAHQG